MSTTRRTTTRRQFVLTVYGDDESGYQDALSEATRLMNEGCLSGINCNPRGGFTFDSPPDQADKGCAADAHSPASA